MISRDRFEPTVIARGITSGCLRNDNGDNSNNGDVKLGTYTQLIAWYLMISGKHGEMSGPAYFVPMIILICKSGLSMWLIVIVSYCTHRFVHVHTIHFKITDRLGSKVEDISCGQMLRWKLPNEELDPKDAMIAGISWRHADWLPQCFNFQRLWRDFLYGSRSSLESDQVFPRVSTTLLTCSFCRIKCKPIHPSLRGFPSNMQQMMEHEGESSHGQKNWTDFADHQRCVCQRTPVQRNSQTAKTNITGNLETVVKNCQGLLPWWKLMDVPKPMYCTGSE